MKQLEENYKSFFYLYLGFLLLTLFFPLSSWATDPTQGLLKPICAVYTLITGSLGKVIAAILIAITGIMVMLGKASIPLLLILVAGIGLIFGSSYLILTLTNTTDATVKDICPA